jgi:transcriptional regulator with XRE-family HTH domain
VGSRIAQRRERLGWSKTEAARRLGVPRSRYAKWESGAHFPSPASLLLLSDGLETSVEDLLTGRDPLAWVRALPPAERLLVAEVLEAVAGWLRGDR